MRDKLFNKRSVLETGISRYHFTFISGPSCSKCCQLNKVVRLSLSPKVPVLAKSIVVMHSKSYSYFFDKKWQHFNVYYVWKFHVSLTNDIFRFKQLGPGILPLQILVMPQHNHYSNLSIWLGISLLTLIRMS